MQIWEIDQWCKDVEAELYSRVRLFTIDVLTSAVSFSPEVNVAPYAQGHFIANWNVGYGKQRGTTSMTMNKAQKIASINAELSIDYFKKYSSVHMTNNLHYALKVEEQGWTRGPEQAYAPVTKMVSYIQRKYA